jgi:hypothetical protein
VENIDEVLKILNEHDNVFTSKEVMSARRILIDTRDGYKVLLKYLAKEDEVQGRRKEVEE